MLVAVAVWAGYSLLLRRRPADLPQMVTLVFSIAVALPMLLPFMLVAASGNQLHLSFPVLIGTFYIAIFGSVIYGAPFFMASLGSMTVLPLESIAKRTWQARPQGPVQPRNQAPQTKVSLHEENRHRFAKKIDGRTCRLVAIPAAELYDSGIEF